MQASLVERGKDGTYAFIHDRVYEAFLARVSADKARDIHERIAHVLDKADSTDSPEQLLAVAYHYAMGHPEHAPIERALEIAEQLGDPANLAIAMSYKGFSLHFSGKSREAEEQARRTKEEFGQWLDPHTYMKVLMDLVANLAIRGYFHEAEEMIRAALRRGGSEYHPYNYYGTGICAGMGRNAQAVEYRRKAEKGFSRIPKQKFVWGGLTTNLTLMCLEQREFGAELDEVLKIRSGFDYAPSKDTFHLTFFYVYLAYIRMYQALRAAAGERPARLEALKAALADCHKVAKIPQLRCHALVQQATLAWLQGEDPTAALNQAADDARYADSPWGLFEIACLRAPGAASAGQRGRGSPRGELCALPGYRPWMGAPPRRCRGRVHGVCRTAIDPFQQPHIRLVSLPEQVQQPVSRAVIHPAQGAAKRAARGERRLGARSRSQRARAHDPCRDGTYLSR